MCTTINSGFLDALRAWAYAYCCTNMWCERLLAAIRNATDDGDVDVERVCASGMLTQFATEHRKRLGEEPGYTTRKHLLEDNVSLRCQVAGEPTKQEGTFCAWMREQDLMRKKERRSAQCRAVCHVAEAEVYGVDALTQGGKG